jgi:large subunit ribosomal protein L7/L12
MSKVQTIIDEMKDLTLIEASELVKAIEDTFDVTASAPAAVAVAAPAGAAAGGDEAEEKTEFVVKVNEVPADKKIAVIKVVKNLLNIGLGDAKTMVEGAPFQVGDAAMKKEDAEDAKKQLTEAGAAVVLE